MPNPLDVIDPKYHELAEEFYHLNQDAIGDIQRGIFEQPTFYGNHAMTQAFANFRQGATSASKYGGRARPKLSSSVETLMATVASRMVSRGNVKLDVAEKFLRILANVDSATDFNTIIKAIGLSDKIGVSMMGDIEAILKVPEIENAAFLANALSALVDLFEKYIRAASKATNSEFDVGSMIESMLSMFSLGSSGSAKALMDSGSIETKLGNFLSEVVLGQRIPMPVIAQNPMKEAPSYVGKVFMGELPGTLSFVDIKELFPKKIAAFPSPANGAGVSSFKFQNFSSFSGAQSLSSVINNLNFGSPTVPAGSYLEELSNTQFDKVKNLLGASDDEKIELTRADHAIPFMIAASSLNTNTDTSPFPTQAFQEGWNIASSLTGYLAQEQNDFLKKIRGDA